MIIYQTCPNRIYPTLAQVFTGFAQDANDRSQWKYLKDVNCFKYMYQYRDIFELINCSQKMMILACQIGLLDYYPDYPLPRKYKDIKRKFFKDKNIHFITKEHCPDQLELEEKEIEFLFGVFPGKRLYTDGSKLKGDFSFTFLDHPVSQVYNIYYYLNFLRKRLYNIIGYPYKKEERPLNQESVSLQNILYCHFTKLYPTIENYIDNFIKFKGQFIFNNYGVKFNLFPEHFGEYTKGYKEHDFYGIIDSNENALKSLNILNNSEIFKKNNLVITEEHLKKFLKKSSIIKPIDYRKNEIEKILKDDIDFYESKKSLIV